MTELPELISSPERPTTYGAIVIPSYGMSKESGAYRLSFFSGNVCRAAYELWKDGVAHNIIIEGARIFPNDPKNDGDLMKALLLKLGVPEDAIIQRRNNKNTYTQLLDAKRVLGELGIIRKVLTVYADLHKLRVPDLLKNYRINSDSRKAEDILSEKYPAFRKAWEIIRNDPSYKNKAEDVEAKMAKALKVDPQGMLARLANWALFPFTGADVPDVRHRKVTRVFAGIGKSH